jgi:hypothetical protein
MFAEIKNNVVLTFPYNYDALVKANPYTNFPANTDLLDLYVGTEANQDGCTLEQVKTAVQPTFDVATQELVVNDTLDYKDGAWLLGWVVKNLTQEQQAVRQQQKAMAVREQRNQKLKDSDWTQLADAPVDKASWAAYRQELRDISAQPGFPWTVDWPVAPGA